MNRKLKNTFVLLGLLLFIVLAGGIYLFVIQKGSIDEKKVKLKELNSYDFNTEQLTIQYMGMLKRAASLDSILASRKFNIPQNLSSIKFFNFMNQVTAVLSPDTHMDVEFLEQKQDKEFSYYEYKLAGAGPYNDIYNLIYSLEQSKELKKIKEIVLTNQISTDKHGMPKFFVNFSGTVNVYFSKDNRFTTAEFVENDLSTPAKYDAFYPLIRTQIPPNVDGMLDVQGAKLLALIPEGAFLADTRGNTYLLWEGEQVYLGYLTNIDYEHNTVSFILNKGGIIERIELGLDREANKKNK